MNNQLTINELRAYQAGQLDGPARHRVERLLLEDPFYADALEGLEALQRTGASLPKQTAQLRRALHERINESATERRLFPLWVTTMAASIVLVMGVALYFVYTTNSGKIAVKKPTTSTHSEPIVVEIGPNDSAIAKTVETVAVLESHAARLRGENRLVEHARFTERDLVSHPRPVSAQAAFGLAKKMRPVRIQAEDATPQTVATVIELATAITGPEQPSAEFAMQVEESQKTSRRILNPERAFGPNAPEAPEVTFWSDNSPRLSLARSFASPRLTVAQEATLMNKRSADQSMSFETLKDSMANGISLAPVTVVGYGTQSRRELTGAVSAVKSAPAPRFVPTQTERLKTVEGTVTDQQGEPLPGVQIMVKGTNRGTTTNAAGQFSLDSTLVSGQMLSVAYIGFKAQELNPVILKKGPIQLMEDTQALSEVVVTGYGRVKPKSSMKAQVGGVNNVSVYVTELSETEGQAFLNYVKKEATPHFQGPLSVQIRTKADGSIKRVNVEDGILIEELDGKRHRDYKPTPEVVAEAERLVRQYPNWPKKRQSFLWIMGWGK